MMVKTPYKVTIFLDADATVCAVDRLTADLLRPVAVGDTNLIFKTSVWKQGYGMTQGNRTHPHPSAVKTSADLEAWSHTPRAPRLNSTHQKSRDRLFMLKLLKQCNTLIRFEPTSWRDEPGFPSTHEPQNKDGTVGTLPYQPWY